MVFEPRRRLCEQSRIQCGHSYAWGPLNFGAGYLHLNSAARTPGQVNTNGAVTDTPGASLQALLSPTSVPLGALAARQQTWGGGVNYAFGPAVAGFVYTQTNLTQLFQTGFSTHFQNFEGNVRYALTPAAGALGRVYVFPRRRQCGQRQSALEPGECDG